MGRDRQLGRTGAAALSAHLALLFLLHNSLHAQNPHSHSDDGQDVNTNQQFRGQNLSFTSAANNDEPEI